MKMPNASAPSGPRQQLIDDLNGDLSREYQAIIAYIVYSQVIEGAEYMKIASELELHAGEELQHALAIAKRIDYLCGAPNVVARPVKTSSAAPDMLRFDLDNENRDHSQLPATRPPVRSAGGVRDGRAVPHDPGPGAGAPDRPRDGAGYQRSQHVEGRLGQVASVEVSGPRAGTIADRSARSRDIAGGPLPVVHLEANVAWTALRAAPADANGRRRRPRLTWHRRCVLSRAHRVARLRAASYRGFRRIRVGGASVPWRGD